MRKLAILSALAVCLLLTACGGSDTSAYREKELRLRAEALSDLNRWEIGDAPAAGVGYAVFFSVCDGTAPASVWHGVGETLDEAWAAADKSAKAALGRSGLKPQWFRADAVCRSEQVTAAELVTALEETRPGYFRYGLSFDDTFGTALLEGELNGQCIYTASGGVELDALNRYLQDTSRAVLSELPAQYTAFQTFSWLCDETGEVYPLESGRFNDGHRNADPMDAAAAEVLLEDAVSYLTTQIQEDGSFIYGWNAAAGTELAGYNILRHAGTLWAMARRCQEAPTETLTAAVRAAADYLEQQTVMVNGGTYVKEAQSGEIKLGGCALAVIALSECAPLLPEEDYTALCCRLGEGILTMMDADTGAFSHVLYEDGSLKESFRTVYYDGEAAYALGKLYGLTGQQRWLSAAQAAADRFLAEDYTQYGDHWVAYAMDELTKYVTNRGDYYVFALKNAQRHLEQIRGRETVAPTDLELLMATFSVYDRMLQQGLKISGFDERAFLDTIRQRAVRQADACFYPETAMYMSVPAQILGAFGVREDGFRVRIDDVQHTMGALERYAELYDRLLRREMEQLEGEGAAA